jgi:hypothetical protein
MRTWFRAFLAPGRPLGRRNHVGAWIALLTCPCHLAPILLLTSGTALGGALYVHRQAAACVLGGLFVFGLVLLFRRNQSCGI